MSLIQTTNPIESRGYVRPEVLVSTEWVAAHLADPSVRIIESNEDPLVYATGHIPGAVEVDWIRDLNDPLRRDIIGAERFAALLSRLGARPETTLVFYGDKYNWWSAYAFWIFQLYGHSLARILDGGRLKWTQEGRPLTRDVPIFEPTRYPDRRQENQAIRAFREDVLHHVEAQRPLIDVRSPAEYSGERLHMDDYPNEGALRGGHIPGALNVPWSRAVHTEDGTFKSAEELRSIYAEECNLEPEDDTIVYCRIGERSSHTWFVLSYLLGFRRVRNYDGSWTEWGNLVGAPIER